MEKFTVLRAVAAPLLQSNINTDAIAPVNPPKSRAASHGERLFANWRYDLGGSEKPDFVLNQPRYRQSKILLAGPNFGCGSSRETAVWSLMGFGIRCVIAPSFGDIFFDNSFQNGLLPLCLGSDDIRRISDTLGAANDPTLMVDLTRLLIELPGGRRIGFEVADDRRTMLLEGLAQIDLLRRHLGTIAAYEQDDAERRPWIYATQGIA